MIVEARKWFKELQEEICNHIQKLDRPMVTHNSPTKSGWYQEHRVIYGDIFEKGTVNFSDVSGEFKEEFAKQIPGTENSHKYLATGISVVLHFVNPKVPAMHFNTRMLETGIQWYGGGFDVTPCLPNDGYKNWYHLQCKEVCDKHDPIYYEKFSKACNEYFYLPHRKETRGIGGLFFEYYDPKDMSFDFVKDAGRKFIEIMNQTVKWYSEDRYTEEDKEAQLIKRGRYVEFNLMYDRGTKFGLQTGGNMDAILMSLPPEVKWK